MKTTLADWANIAEVVGAFAIVVSLVFVGFEIRDNTRATQNATFQQHTSDEVRLLETLANHTPEFNARYNEYALGLDAVPDRGTGDPAFFQYMAAMRAWENLYLQHLNGSLADWAWCSRKPLIDQFLNGATATVLAEANIFAQEFAEYILAGADRDDVACP